MAMLIAAAVAFLALHLLVAGTRVRDVIVDVVGERAYLGMFSLASAGGIVWLALGYNAATAAGSDVLWDLGPGVRHLGYIVVGVAFLLGVPGLMTPNPTIVGMEGAVAHEVTGILRVTRHPFLWSVALWAAFHLLVNGDTASIVFFGTLLTLAVVGTFSIDAKRVRKMGAAWTPFAQRTSNVPFAAILAGRNALKLAELAGWRQAVALAAFLVVLFAHEWVFGASPF
jgi:uncharacterized membrane protein